jgi:hypothetical protein
LELEGRALLANLVVSNTDDSGPGSLRAAVGQANSDGGGDTIVFSSLLDTAKTITRPRRPPNNFSEDLARKSAGPAHD